MLEISEFVYEYDFRITLTAADSTRGGSREPNHADHAVILKETQFIYVTQ